MEYRQQIIEDVINKNENGLFHNTRILSGRRVEKKSGVVIETSNYICNEDIDAFLLFVERIRIEELIYYIEKKLSNISCSIFTNIHREKISINNIKDSREYGYIKIVCKDCTGGLLYKEIPIYCADYQENIRERVDKEVEIISRNIRQNRSYLGKQEYINQRVLFSQQAAGYFIHEVVGHMLEEDIYDYSYKLFEKIPEILTVIDNPYGYENLIGLGQYDDLGIRNKPVTLIENGKIKNLLSIHKNMCGTARRSSYKNDVLPRMRCTYIEKSSQNKKKDYIRANHEIIYVENIYSGVASFVDGRYKIAGEGKVFKNSIECGYITDLTISGSILEYLNNIVDIGDDLKIYPAECNKLGNIIRVGLGGPCILLDNINVRGTTYIYE